jgi:hypothetical protein
MKFKNHNVLVYGHSLGTGPSIDIAIDKNYPLAGIILQAPFLSILRTISSVTIFINP